MVFHVGRIVAKTAASPTVTVLRLHVPSFCSFLPGQWVDFQAPPHKFVGGFSIASSPNDLPHLTLAIKASSQAPSQWVTTESNVGDTVNVQVGGTCVLKHYTKQHAVFCAGGIGISPLLSMYRQHVQERRMKNASFLYLVSKEEELVFAEELVKLASIHNDRLVLSLTQQDEWKEIKSLSNTNVECLTGRDVMRTFLQHDTENATYYICGPPSMLNDAIDLLEQEKGVPSSNIIYEKWW